MKKILFVCLGNICRSPMAEAIFKHTYPNQYEVASAATSSWEHGNPVHRGTQKVLKDMGILVHGKTSRPIQNNDFEYYDYIIGMDKQNIRDLKDMAPKAYHDKIYLYLDSRLGLSGENVPDPWYTGNFEETKQLILEGLEPWNRFLK